jgi:hypothetical protein
MSLISFALSSFLLAAAGLPAIEAELVLTGGKVWTVDAKLPEAHAVAVWRGQIVAVGDDAAVEAFAGPRTRRIELAGRRVLPGFVDSHVHLLAGGLQLARVDLRDAADEAEFGRRLREFDRKLPPGRWLLGDNWDHDRTFGGHLPTAELLDRFVHDRPVFLSRYDGHMALVNTRTLRLAAITAGTLDPPGGEVHRLPGYVIIELQRELLLEFGGYTIHATSQGRWQTREGRLYQEEVVTYEVAVPEAKIPVLRDIVVRLGRQLGQLAIYFDAPPPSVQIIDLSGPRTLAGGTSDEPRKSTRTPRRRKKDRPQS